MILLVAYGVIAGIVATAYAFQWHNRRHRLMNQDDVYRNLAEGLSQAVQRDAERIYWEQADPLGGVDHRTDGKL